MQKLQKNKPVELINPDVVKFDLERMKKALSSKTITLPPGLSREEIIAFIKKTTE